ncbi:MAG: adenosylhomocysteinase [Symbiobacteriia bacterium]
MPQLQSVVRDPALAPAGHLKIEWVARHMPVLNEIRREFEATRPLAGKRVAICLHLEAKTAYLCKVLAASGAEVAIAGSNPLSTQDDVAAALAEDGIAVYAWYGATSAEYFGFINRLLDNRPNLLIDDGGDLVATLHGARRDALEGVIGGAEETRTGVMRLRNMERDGVLAFPMVAVNDARMKSLFDNRYGTGQSVWDGIMRTTNLVIAGKTVVVGGYGWCGKGVAMRAKGLGADVVVCEVDPIAANEALMDGFRVMPSLAAAASGDIFVTVTGCKGVFGPPHFQVMKDGAILANAGHFDVEVDVAGLRQIAAKTREVRRNVEEFCLPDGRCLYVLAGGRLVNLAAGDGHPTEIMDLSFAVQALTLAYLAEHGKEVGGHVVPVPGHTDQRVAALRLAALGVQIDRLSDEQSAYLTGWKGE